MAFCPSQHSPHLAFKYPESTLTHSGHLDTITEAKLHSRCTSVDFPLKGDRLYLLSNNRHKYEFVRLPSRVADTMNINISIATVAALVFVLSHLKSNILAKEVEMLWVPKLAGPKTLLWGG